MTDDIPKQEYCCDEHEQIAKDADFGYYWRQIEATLPWGYYFKGLTHHWLWTSVKRDQDDNVIDYTYYFPKELPSWHAETYAPTDDNKLEGNGKTPTEALEDLLAKVKDMGEWKKE